MGMGKAIDPITFSVVQGTLKSITKEMTVTMERTCRSPILTMAHDYSNTICDWVPRIIVQGDDLPAQLGGVALIVKGVTEYWGDKIHPGDILYCNDPGMGNTHLGEMNMFKPVFYQGELLFWVIQRSHMTDTGGGAPGTMNPAAEEIYAEGFRFPPIKLYDRGVPQQVMFDVVLKNVRMPRAQLGDMRGQFATVNIAEKRLLALLDRYGKETIKACVEELLDRSERMMRQEIARIPDGVYEGKATLEDPDRPLESITRRSFFTPRAHQQEGPMIEGIKDAVKNAQAYRVDGVINFAHLGCRQSCGIIRSLMDALKEQVGVPTVTLDCDFYDPTSITLDEIKEKLGGFFEILEGR